jgi:hypothetical protein
MQSVESITDSLSRYFQISEGKLFWNSNNVIVSICYYNK